MTQKELLYVEDAIGHEKSIISICRKAIEKLDNHDFKNYLNNEISNHEAICNELMTLLKGRANG